MKGDQRTVFTADQTRSSYPEGIEFNYWHWARNRIITASLRTLDLGDGVILDIGCGPGINVHFLEQRGFRCFGVEVAEEYADISDVKNIWWGKTFQELENSIKERTKCVLLLDVIEHIEDREQFLCSIENEFPNLQYIYVTVPARAELWSNFDEFYGHYLRFDFKQARLLGNSSTTLKIKSLRYLFHSLYIAGLLQLIVKRRRPERIRGPVLRWPQQVIGAFLLAETCLLPGRLPGSSMEIILERQR